MLDTPTALLIAALLLNGAMLVAWTWAFVGLNFQQALPVLRWFVPIAALSAVAATISAPETARALPFALLAFPAMYYCIQAISAQPDTRGIAVGEPIRDFSAPDQNGHAFALESLRGQTYVLKFYRGHWCPYCRTELSAWHSMQEQLSDRGLRFVAISPDTVAEVARFAASHADYAMQWLSDADLKVTDLYNLRSDKTLALGWGRKLRRPLSIPTTIVVDETGIVRWVDQSIDHQVRSNPRRVLPSIDAALARRHQPTHERNAPRPSVSASCAE